MFSVYRLLLTVKCSSSVLGHSAHFRFLPTQLIDDDVSRKRVNRRAKRTKI